MKKKVGVKILMINQWCPFKCNLCSKVSPVVIMDFLEFFHFSHDFF